MRECVSALPLSPTPLSSPRICCGRSALVNLPPRWKTDQHLKQTYIDPAREQELGECNILIDLPEPEVQFDMSELQLKEVREVVRKARSSSAPGPSGNSYKVYKNCPKFLLGLWKILRVFWRRGRIPDQWRVAEGVWIPKEEDTTQLDQFCIISLLCIEAKIFLSTVTSVYLP